MAGHPLEGPLRARRVSSMITGSRLVYELSPAGSLELGREGGDSGRAMCCGILVCGQRGGGGELTACTCPSSSPSSSSSSSPASPLPSGPSPLMSLLPRCQVIHITVGHHGGGRGGGDWRGRKEVQLSMLKSSCWGQN